MKYVYKTKNKRREIALLEYYPEERNINIFRYNIYSLV